MQPPGEELTEKKLVEDFERINDQIQKKAREYQIDQPAPLTVPDEGGFVIEPVYSYEVHASS